MTNDQMTRKYILKPGKHQFVPGSAATHDNDNLSDKEAAWYIKRYPHIRSQFAQLPTRSTVKQKEQKSEVTA